MPCPYRDRGVSRAGRRPRGTQTRRWPGPGRGRWRPCRRATPAAGAESRPGRWRRGPGRGAGRARAASAAPSRPTHLRPARSVRVSATLARAWAVRRRAISLAGARKVPSAARSSGGLSPPVRGNRSTRTAPRWITGSIPARAGEPPTPRLQYALLRVYPRPCGGTIASSRSIPARAGEPGFGVDRPAVVGVYPRPCGGTGKSALHTQRKRVYPRPCGGTVLR